MIGMCRVLCQVCYWLVRSIPNEAQWIIERMFVASEMCF